jgi:hypothetical protein
MTSIPNKNHLLPGATAGQFAAALGQFYDFVEQYTNTDGEPIPASAISAPASGNLPAGTVASQLAKLGGVTLARNNSTAYALGAITYSPTLPSYAYAECTVAGTTAAIEPVWPAEGSTVTDGTVTWVVRDMRQSAIVSSGTGWIKFADGTMIQHGISTIAVGNFNTITVGSTTVYTSYLRLSYPLAFYAAPSDIETTVACNLFSAQSSMALRAVTANLNPGIGYDAKQACTIAGTTPTLNETLTFHWQAIGRWKA